MKLYEISNQYLEAFNKLQEMDLDEQTITDSLALIEDDFNNKAINVASIIKNIEADIEAMKEAEKRIYDRRKAQENEIKGIKEYLKFNMKKCEIKSIFCPYFNIGLRKCVDALNEPKDEKEKIDIPKKYLREKITYSPDKAKIRADLEKGIPVKGYSLEENYSLTIK